MNLSNYWPGVSPAMRKCVFLGAALLTAFALEAPARANGIINLVQNGSFETTTLSASGFFTTTDVSNWSTSSYTFLVFPNTAQTNIGNSVKLYPGITNTMPSTSPDGGNFVAADGAYQSGAISQQINGLMVGEFYTLNFYQAGAQQQGYNGATTDRFQVSLLDAANHGQTFLSALMTNPSHDFQPWQLQTMTFQATSITETLSFLAVGTPTGVPPFSLLDGVSLTQQTPEPAGLAIVGLGLIGLAVRRHRRKQV